MNKGSWLLTVAGALFIGAVGASMEMGLIHFLCIQLSGILGFAAGWTFDEVWASNG